MRISNIEQGMSKFEGKKILRQLTSLRTWAFVVRYSIFAFGRRNGNAVNEDKKFDLQERLVDFAVRIINVVEALPESRAGRQVANQLIRSGTSPAAERTKNEYRTRNFEIRRIEEQGTGAAFPSDFDIPCSIFVFRILYFE